VCWATCAEATIARVSGQTPNGASNASATSINFPFAQNVASGNVVIVGVVAFATAPGTPPNDFTVSDNLGNTWVQDFTDFLVDEQRNAIWRTNITTGGAMTVTFSIASGARRLAVSGMEYTFAGGATFDKSSSGSAAQPGNTSADSGATPTTTAANELLFSYISDTFDGTPYTWTNSFSTVFDGGSVGRSGSGDRIVSVTGAYNATATLAAANGWLALIGTYKEAGGGGCTPTLTLLGVGRCGD
jgi:hypothetical protein